MPMRKVKPGHMAPKKHGPAKAKAHAAYTKKEMPSRRKVVRRLRLKEYQGQGLLSG